MTRNRQSTGSIAVLFEVTPKPGCTERYLEIASQLKQDLACIPGFSGVGRFSSLTTQGKYLSLSFWDSEKAASCWRNHVLHRAAQLEGRTALFADYKITVAVVQCAYTAENRTQAPADSSAFFQS